jgi:hypothetical protein
VALSSGCGEPRAVEAGIRRKAAPRTKKNKSLLLLFFRKEESSFLKERSKELLFV